MTTCVVLPLLLMGVAGHTQQGMAQSMGTFTATDNLSRPRQFHTATLLTKRQGPDCRRVYGGEQPRCVEERRTPTILQPGPSAPQAT
jgi:hypothetical protein